MSSRFSLCYSTGYMEIAPSNMHTKESGDYTFIGIVYTYLSHCQEIYFICIGCPTLVSMCPRMWGGSLGPSSCHWMKATSHPCEIFRGLHCVAAVTLPPRLHGTLHCIINSNPTLHCVVNSASLSTWESPSPSRDWRREG